MSVATNFGNFCTNRLVDLAENVYPAKLEISGDHSK